MRQFTCVLFDIDGTLADVEHRRVHVRGPRKDWRAFFEAMVHDTPVPEMVWLCNSLYNFHDADENFRMLLVTGRPDDYRVATTNWLRYHGIKHHGLVMRAAGDNRDDTVVKSEMLHSLRARGYRVLFAVDDRQKVVDMWRREGVLCLQCAPGDFDVGPAVIPDIEETDGTAA